MSLGLQRGYVSLEPHRIEWEISASVMIETLKKILKNVLVDAQHIGSTSIKSIPAKPIIDIAVGVSGFEQLMNCNDILLGSHGGRRGFGHNRILSGVVRMDETTNMEKKKRLIVITGIILVGIANVWVWSKSKPVEQMIIKRLNEAVSYYTDMNIKDDGAYSLKVSDTQMLVTTYMPEYIIYGVSIDEYTVRPGQIDETLTTEKEQDLPICNYDNVLLYDEKADRFYNVKFEEKGSPVIPNFTEAKELAYELGLPGIDAVEQISLKKNSDSPIVINSKDDVEKIMDILKGIKPTTKGGEIGTPVRVENIICADFIGNGDVICRLFFYEDEGEHFIEQTGNGVYPFSKEAYDLIDNYIPDINYEP